MTDLEQKKKLLAQAERLEKEAFSYGDKKKFLSMKNLISKLQKEITEMEKA